MQQRNSKQPHSWIRWTGMAVVSGFLFSTTSAPFAQASLWKERKTASIRPNADFPINIDSVNNIDSADIDTDQAAERIKKILEQHSQQKNLTPRKHSQIPPSLWEKISAYGEIERVYLKQGQTLRLEYGKLQTTQPIVIHIQDLHSVSSAQKNIAFLSKELMDSGIDFAGVEGASGPLPELEKWRSYPDKKSLLKVAGFLLNQTLLTGIEAAGLADSYNRVQIMGVEDKEAYLAQVAAFKGSLKHAKAVKKWQNRFEKNLTSLKEKIYNPDLYALDQENVSYQKREKNLGQWLSFLTRHAKHDFPNVKRYLDAYQIEQETDFKKVEKEQARLVKALSQKRSGQEMTELVEECLMYRLGKISTGDFYVLLEERCRKANVKLSPLLQRYVDYVELSEQMDHSSFYKEISQLEIQGYENLIKSKEEKSLYRTAKDFDLVKKALDFRLNPQEWQEFTERRTELSNSVFLMPAEVQRVVINAVRFSKLSEKRNAIFVDQVRTQIRQGKNSGILIAGGWHSKGIEENLKQQGISFITVRPKVETQDILTERHPLTAFMRNPLPLEKLFAQEKISLSPPLAMGSIMPTPSGNAVITTFNNVVPLVTEAEQNETNSAYAFQSNNSLITVQAEKDKNTEENLPPDVKDRLKQRPVLIEELTNPFDPDQKESGEIRVYDNADVSDISGKLMLPETKAAAENFFHDTGIPATEENEALFTAIYEVFEFLNPVKFFERHENRTPKEFLKRLSGISQIYSVFIRTWQTLIQQNLHPVKALTAALLATIPLHSSHNLGRDEIQNQMRSLRYSTDLPADIEKLKVWMNQALSQKQEERSKVTHEMIQILGALSAAQQDEEVQKGLSLLFNGKVQILPEIDPNLLEKSVSQLTIEINRPTQEDQQYTQTLSALSKVFGTNDLGTAMRNAFAEGYAMVETAKEMAEKPAKKVTELQGGTHVIDIESLFETNASPERKTWLLQFIQATLSNLESEKRVAFISNHGQEEMISKLKEFKILDGSKDWTGQNNVRFLTNGNGKNISVQWLLGELERLGPQWVTLGIDLITDSGDRIHQDSLENKKVTVLELISAVEAKEFVSMTEVIKEVKNSIQFKISQ